MLAAATTAMRQNNTEISQPCSLGKMVLDLLL